MRIQDKLFLLGDFVMLENEQPLQQNALRLGCCKLRVYHNLYRDTVM